MTNAEAVAESVRRSPGAAALRRLGRRHWLGLLVFAIAMAAFLLLAGGAGGLAANLAKMQGQARLLQAAAAPDPEAAAAATAALAAAVDDGPVSRALLAMAYLRAASLAPRQRECWEKALREVEFALAAGEARGAFPPEPAAGWDGPGGQDGGEIAPARAPAAFWRAGRAFAPGAKIQLRLMHSAVLLELGREGEALAALSAIEPDGLDAETRRAYDNACAYLYATAAAPGVRDPEAALRHALAAVPDWRACDDAALLDTLAAALAANGRRAAALQVQRRAWGLAPVDGLWVYQDNWRKIAAAGAAPGARSAPAATATKEDEP